MYYQMCININSLVLMLHVNLCELSHHSTHTAWKQLRFHRDLLKCVSSCSSSIFPWVV